MTRDEMLQVMALVSVYWPHWQIPDTDDEADFFVAAWERLLGDLDVAPVVAAIDALATEGERHAPGPGRVRSKAISLTQPTEAPTEDEAWAEVKMMIRRVGSLVYYDKHDRVLEWSHPAIEQVVGSLGWKTLCESENEVADRAHFRQMYAERVRTDANRAAVPSSVEAVRALADSKRLELGETA